MKKVIYVVLFLLLIFIGFVLFFDNNNVVNENFNFDKSKINKSEWSTNNKIVVNNVYNYDTDEMEAGTLIINNGVLEFIDLKNEVLNSYKYIDDVKVIDKIYDYCDNKTYYIILTNEGEIYLSDNNDFMAEEPFYKFELDKKIIEISIPVSKECSDLIINALNIDNEKVEIELKPLF